MYRSMNCIKSLHTFCFRCQCTSFISFEDIFIQKICKVFAIFLVDQI